MLAKRNAIALLLFFAAFGSSLLILPPALADFSFLPSKDRAVPDIASWKKDRSSRWLVNASEVPDLSTEERKALIDQLSTDLQKQYDALAAVPKPAACTDNSAIDYAFALRALGKHAECVQFARECGASPPAGSPLILLVGAQCENDRLHPDKAEEFFQQATSQKFSQSPDFRQVVFEFATYENFGAHPELVDSILARETSWNDDTRALWKGLIRRAGKAGLGSLTKVQVDKFLSDEIPKHAGNFHDLLVSLKISIAIDDDQLKNALDDLKSNSANFKTPMHWYYLAYQAVYFGFGTDFQMSRRIYDIYDKLADQWVKLPVEYNTYNYSEIYGSACTQNLLSGDDLASFKNLKDSLRKGTLSFEDALVKTAALAEKFPAKADVLTTYGGLLSMAGRHDESMAVFWRAHRACRYYNRANWGITLEKRFRRYSTLPDYASNEAKAAEAVNRISVPAVTSRYFVNWNSLPKALQDRVILGSRIWVPFFETLANAKSSVFIKSSFDLLSESPGMADIADERIEGNGHDTDHRLWDDVRGVGGEVVVADANEVFQTVQGDYNLLGHEMTHQFHHFLINQKLPLANCIENQFALSQKLKNFPDSYSASNSAEHFAQGVTYYLVPPDSPERFGLNQSWLPKNNKLQFDFIQSIEASGGSIAKINCSASEH